VLVLSRKKDEALCIGDDIRIVVVEMRGDKVRLGIVADPKIPVHRLEVYEAIKRNEAAGQRIVTPGQVYQEQRTADSYRRAGQSPKVNLDGIALEKIEKGEEITLSQECIERIALRRKNEESPLQPCPFCGTPSRGPNDHLCC
jgi:carbon storage regulator